MAAYICLNCGQLESSTEDCCDNRDLFCVNDMPKKIKQLRAELEQSVSAQYLDARRYRRLRVLGCAPDGSQQLAQGTVIRFSVLDGFVDTDLEIQESRGEAEAQPEPVGEVTRTISSCVVAVGLYGDEIPVGTVLYTITPPPAQEESK